MRLLHAIRDRLQAGTVNTEAIRLYGSDAFAFLASIAPFLVGERAQMELVLANKHLLALGGLNEKQVKEREAFLKTLSDMKHEGAWSTEDEARRQAMSSAT